MRDTSPATRENSPVVHSGHDADTSPSNRHEVVVIGAGVAGTCAALALIRNGHDVTLIDRDGPGENCSFGNAGIICDATSSLPMPSMALVRQIPGMLMDWKRNPAIRWRYLPKLAPWLIAFLRAANHETRMRNARAFHSLLCEAPASWDRLVSGTDAEKLIRKRGMLLAYSSEEGFDKGRGDRDLLGELGVSLHEISRDELRQMEPALSDSVVCATYQPEVYQALDPYLLVRAVADQFLSAGGRIVEDDVVDFRHGNGRVDTVVTRSGELKVDKVVVAAGAWSARVLAKLGVKTLLDTERGYHTVFHDYDSGLSRPIIHGEEHFGMAQMSGGMRFAGTVEFAGIDAAPDYRRADLVVECGRHALRNFDPPASTRVTRWMGRRPTLPDFLPAIGKLAGLENVVVNFGHQHLGLTLGARSGFVVSDIIAGRDPGLDVKPFRAERF